MILREPKYDLRTGYRQRLLASAAGALLLINTAVAVWPPASGRDSDPEVTQGTEQEVIRIAEVVPTRHEAAPRGNEKTPAITAPLPPVAVPDDIILEEDELDFESLFAEEVGPHAEHAGSTTGVPGATGDPEGATAATPLLVPPKPFGLVEPEYPEEAKRKRVRAEIRIEVLVDASGAVRQTKVLERYLLTSSGRQRVALLGYGLEEAAIDAARRWRFRPAQRNGEPVEHAYTLSMTIGPRQPAG